MIERQFLQPDDMWARVENGNLLYVPVVTVRGTDHAHIYLAGQMAREPSGAIVGVGDMRAQIRKTCENIGKGLAYAGATFDDVACMFRPANTLGSSIIRFKAAGVDDALEVSEQNRNLEPPGQPHRQEHAAAFLASCHAAIEYP